MLELHRCMLMRNAPLRHFNLNERFFMQRIILDTDPGLDDALALFLALASPEVQLEAITLLNNVF